MNFCWLSPLIRDTLLQQPQQTNTTGERHASIGRAEIDGEHLGDKPPHLLMGFSPKSTALSKLPPLTYSLSSPFPVVGALSHQVPDPGSVFGHTAGLTLSRNNSVYALSMSSAVLSLSLLLLLLFLLNLLSLPPLLSPTTDLQGQSSSAGIWCLGLTGNFQFVEFSVS